MSDTTNKPPSSTPVLLIAGENYQPDMSLLKASSIGTVERTVKVPVSNDEALSEGRLASTIRRDAEEEQEALKEYVKEQKARIAEMRREAAEHQEVCDTGERDVVMKVWVVPSKKPGHVS